MITLKGHTLVIWNIPRRQSPKEALDEAHVFPGFVHRSYLFVQRRRFLCPFFRWIQCDGINWEKWLKPDTQGSWGNRQTEGPREEGVKPQFLYVVWFQFGKSHHSPVHWGGKPDECVPVCRRIERFFLFFFFLLVLHTCCRKPPQLLIHPDTSTSSLFFNIHCLEESEIEGHAQFSTFAAQWAQKIDTALVSKSVTH